VRVALLFNLKAQQQRLQRVGVEMQGRIVRIRREQRGDKRLCAYPSVYPVEKVLAHKRLTRICAYVFLCCCQSSSSFVSGSAPGVNGFLAKKLKPTKKVNMIQFMSTGSRS
jgi:hypothetical protein